MNYEDERLPDAPGDGTHIHSLDRCEHEVHGDEVMWACGKLPMFTNIATARANAGQVDDSDVVQIIYNDHTDAWEIVLMSREGHQHVLARKLSSADATWFRDRVVEHMRSWFSDSTLAPEEPCQHLSATGVDQSEGPMKVWECDACGWRHYMRDDENGVTHMIPAPLR